MDKHKLKECINTCVNGCKKLDKNRKKASQQSKKQANSTPRQWEGDEQWRKKVQNMKLQVKKVPLDSKTRARARFNRKGREAIEKEKQRQHLYRRNSQTGKGYYYDVGNGEIAGAPVIKGYDDFAPPIFVGELSSDITNNSNILDKKISHINKYIQSGGKHKLPKYVLKDVHKLNKN